ncbi:MAG: alginate export family protein [Alcanivorax sp.]
MLKKKTVKTLLLSTVCALVIQTAPSAFAGDNVESIVKDGNFFGEIRYRYEHVDQDGPLPIVNNAKASTVRTNLGFKTGVYRDFQGLIEGQIVQNIGANDFNDTTNGKMTYPVVADPDVTEINELWLSWSGLPQTSLKAGRQKINIDNQRFVGTVDWRQNDQTFDALQVTNASIKGLDLMYAYVGNVNRIFGDDNPLGDLNSNIHLAHASYEFTDWLKFTGYGYWLDFDRLATRSSRTFGARATGKIPVNEHWAFSYEAEAATQDDHGNNTTSYDEEYYHISPSLSGHGFTFTAGYEVLGGDGTNAFQTPLATLHKFNGWADAFLSTPNAGLEDAYVSGSYKISGTKSLFDDTTFTAIYHDFDSNDSNSDDFGDELDLSVGKSFVFPDAGQPFKKLDVLLKYADYNGNGGVASREKFWLQVGVKF